MLRVPRGLRNIIVINCMVAVVYAVAFLLHYRSHEVIEMRALPLAVIAIAILTGPMLLLQSRLVWRVVRMLCYGFALLVSMFIVTAIFKGFVLSVPVQIILLILFNIYLIGVRGYLNTKLLRKYFHVIAA